MIQPTDRHAGFHDARPGVRSTFGPVSLAYETKLKLGFRRQPDRLQGVGAFRRRAVRELDSPCKLGDSAGPPEFTHPTRLARVG